MGETKNFAPLPGPGEQYNALPGVPEYFVNVIRDVERGKLPFIWTLQKNVDGFSLLLKLPAKSPKRRRRHLESVSKDNLSRQQDHVKPPSCAVPDTVPTRANTPKRKSPSCKLRDRNRRRRWKLKKKSPRPLDTNTSDSDHGTAPDSLSPAADASQNVVTDCLPTQVCEHLTQVCEGPTLDTDTIVSEDLEDSQDTSTRGADPPQNEVTVLESHARCDHCACLESDSTPLKSCMGCHSTEYCSKQCQAAGWKSGHKEYCKHIQETRRQLRIRLGLSSDVYEVTHF